jgi:hypothetical protein
MALPRTLKFDKFTILLGNGATPEVFAQPCGMTDKTIGIDAKSSAVIVPDCDDPTAPAWEDKAVSALSAQVTFSGILSMADFATWNTWGLGGLDKNVQVWLTDTNANGGGYWSGAAILSKLELKAKLGSDGNRVLISGTIDSDGAWPWTPNPA